MNLPKVGFSLGIFTLYGVIGASAKQRYTASKLRVCSYQDEFVRANAYLAIYTHVLCKIETYVQMRILLMNHFYLIGPKIWSTAPSKLYWVSIIV